MAPVTFFSPSAELGIWKKTYLKKAFRRHCSISLVLILIQLIVKVHALGILNRIQTTDISTIFTDYEAGQYSIKQERLN